MVNSSVMKSSYIIEICAKSKARKMSAEILITWHVNKNNVSFKLWK